MNNPEKKISLFIEMKRRAESIGKITDYFSTKLIRSREEQEEETTESQPSSAASSSMELDVIRPETSASLPIPIDELNVASPASSISADELEVENEEFAAINDFGEIVEKMNIASSRVVDEEKYFFYQNYFKPGPQYDWPYSLRTGKRRYLSEKIMDKYSTMAFSMKYNGIFCRFVDLSISITY